MAAAKVPFLLLEPTLQDLTVNRLYCEQKTWVGTARNGPRPGLASKAISITGYLSQVSTVARDMDCDVALTSGNFVVSETGESIALARSSFTHF